VIQPDRVRITTHGIYGLQAMLEQLPSYTHITWMGPHMLKRSGIKPVDLALPARKMIKQVEKDCALLGIQISVLR
jgi:hypothetical protein